MKVLEPLYPSLHNKNENTQGEDCSSSIQTLSDDHQLLSSVNQNASRCHIQEDQSEGDDVTCSATQQDSGRDKDKSKDNVSSGDLEPGRMRQYKMLFDVLQMFLRHFFRSLQIVSICLHSGFTRDFSKKWLAPVGNTVRIGYSGFRSHLRHAIFLCM